MFSTNNIVLKQCQRRQLFFDYINFNLPNLVIAVVNFEQQW